MIRKFLVCSRLPYFTSVRPEDQGTKTPVFELLLPVQLYWDLETRLKKLEYMHASDEEPVVITADQRDLFRKVLKYVVTEKERVMLYELLK